MTPESANAYAKEADVAAESSHRRWWQKTLAVIIPLVIVGAGVAGASYLIKSGPKAAKRIPPRMAPLVSIAPAQLTDEAVVVHAMGTVVPSRRIDLKSSVAGEVIYIHPAFTEGGILKAGETALKIDPTDYRLRIIEREAQVAQAQYALKVEMGHQEVAQREWRLITKGQKVGQADQELALRKPHLQKAQAELKAAQAILEQERKNLERTVITIPFNAMVSEVAVDVGSQITAQTSLATLTGTDRYWVQTSIPVDRLNWIKVPGKNGENGAGAIVYQNSGTPANLRWQGQVVRLLGDLDPKGRMARILIAVDDPLHLTQNPQTGRPLLLGAYVHTDIAGRQLSQVIRLPRSIVHANDTVWVLTDKGTLSLRTVSIIWRDTDAVLINQGIQAGEQIIVSDLATPVDGMQLRTDSAGSSPNAKTEEEDAS